MSDPHVCGCGKRSREISTPGHTHFAQHLPLLYCIDPQAGQIGLRQRRAESHHQHRHGTHHAAALSASG